ncbi:hypothetical protein UK23_23830 [Lentzea aerocolonigenes]|uniref:DNA-binding phage zinc finger domain-containing protein n=1 Tax=Lentzea aerocolonigenes TaxID=68170 RepID=A0A0F0GY27_LENAE|nr:hypothetical protein [Lentzea aerocolonigenes]KJK46348.1 hypothetical protein UK23_23830 [Lentzea aerocolonigenes]
MTGLVQAARQMTRAEVSTLLGMILSAGHRISAGHEAVAMWRASLTGYSLPECLAALVVHNEFSSVAPRPHDLISHIRRARRLVLNERVLAESTARPDPDEAARASNTHMAAIRAAMGWKRPDEHTAALTVACPVLECGAAAGMPCRRTGTARKGRPENRELRKGVHASRTELAAEQHDQAEQAADTLPRKEIPA